MGNSVVLDTVGTDGGSGRKRQQRRQLVEAGESVRKINLGLPSPTRINLEEP